MKARLLILSFFVALAAQAQLEVQRTNDKIIPVDVHGAWTYSAKIPVHPDTTTALARAGRDSLGLIFKELNSTKVWIRDTVVTGGHKWTQLGAGAGGGTDSALAAQYGLKIFLSGTTRYIVADSFALQSRQRGLKIADSLAAVFNASLALKKNAVDSATNTSSYATRGRLQKVADSLAALISAGGGTDSALANLPGILKSISGTTIYIGADTFYLCSRARALKMVDSLAGITDITNYRSVGATGIDIFNFSTAGNQSNLTLPKFRDTTGNYLGYAADSGFVVPLSARVLKSDSAGSTGYATFLRLKKVADSLGIILSTKLSTVSTTNSVTGDGTGGTPVKLVNDAATPGNGKYYGTNGSGTKGYYTLPAGTSDSGIVAGIGIKVDRNGANDRVVKLDTTSSSPYVVKTKLDLNRLPTIRELIPGVAIAASGTTVTNYPYTAVDNSFFPYTTLNYFSAGGTKYGGVLWNSGGGDSILVTAPCWYLAGSSFMESHRDKHGRLHPNGTNGYVWNYPDSAGTFAYFIQKYTNMRAYVQAVGGQNSEQMRARWSRDILGQVVSATLDGRAAQTVTHKPRGVIYDGVGNDPATGVSADQSIRNLIYMASSCQDNNIWFIVCNSPSGAGPSAAGRDSLAKVNRFLAEGGLNKYGAVVFDLQTFWSDPAYGAMNGVAGNPALVNNVDFTHFTSPVGDSLLALAIYNTCRLPKLAKVIISSALAPANAIANFNYPNAMTIDGQAYTLTNAIDSITITRPLGWDYPHFVYDAGDSVWFKFTGLAHVVGNSTTYGIGHIDWVVDNTADGTDADYYSKNQEGSHGATGTNLDISSLNIRMENNIGTTPILKVTQNDGTGSSFYLLPTGSGPNILWNAGLNTARLNGAIMSIYSNASNVALSGQGSLYFTGTISNKLGLMEYGGTSSPSSFGNGFFVDGTVTALESGSSNLTKDIFRVDKWNTRTPTYTTGTKAYGVFASYTGAGTMGDLDSAYSLHLRFPINQTGNPFPGVAGGIHYYSVRSSTKNELMNGIHIEDGENSFNSNRSMPEGAIFGDSSKNRLGSAALEIKDTTRGFILPRATAPQIANFGYVSGVSLTQGTGYTSPKIDVTGGTGFGASLWVQGTGSSLSAGIINPGRGYNPGTPVTGTVTGTAGTGATATLTLHGPDVGMMVFNTTADSAQVQSAAGMKTLAYTSYADAAASSAVAAVKSYINTADAATITNTTLSSSLIGTGSGSLSFPANFFTVGKMMHIRVEGIISTDASNPNISIGGGILGNAVGIATFATPSLSNSFFWLDIIGVMRTTGASGTMYLTARSMVNGVETGYDVGSITFNTGASQSISSFTGAWTTASTNNSITAKMFLVENR